jgi:endonuclease G
MEPRSSAKVTTKDYTNPGSLFERGHIVPSYAMWSRFGDEARQATFVMVNVFPQDGDLNGRIWEDLEDDIAGQTKGGVVTDEGYAGRLRGITVFAGPIYRNGDRRLPSGIPIPDACFTVIYDVVEQEQRLRARAYLIENRPGLPGPPTRYATTLRAIEDATGLDFMPDGGATADALELAPPVSDPW